MTFEADSSRREGGSARSYAKATSPRKPSRGRKSKGRTYKPRSTSPNVQKVAPISISRSSRQTLKTPPPTSGSQRSSNGSSVQSSYGSEHTRAMQRSGSRSATAAHDDRNLASRKEFSQTSIDYSINPSEHHVSTSTNATTRLTDAESVGSLDESIHSETGAPKSYSKRDQKSVPKEDYVPKELIIDELPENMEDFSIWMYNHFGSLISLDATTIHEILTSKFNISNVPDILFLAICSPGQVCSIVGVKYFV